jgi:hypothetical protein
MMGRSLTKREKAERDWREVMEESERNQAAFANLLEKPPHDIVASSGRYTVLVHPSTDKKGWWQATFFDEKMEPWGDSQSPTWERLLDHIRYEVDWTKAKRASARPNQGHLPGVQLMLEQGEGALEDYFPETAAGEMEVLDENLYYGRNVIWDGYEGRMIRAYPDYTQHIWGNIFDADKLAAVVSGIDEAEDRLVFTAPYGTASRIDLETVAESQSGWEDDGLDRPYTTGDDELDRFLLDEAEVLDEYGEPGDEDRDEAAQDLRERLSEAVRDDEGDLGQWVVTIRNGNHRGFGAFLAGEPYVYVMLSANQVQDLREGVSKGTLTDEDKELLELLD